MNEPRPNEDTGTPDPAAADAAADASAGATAGASADDIADASADAGADAAAGAATGPGPRTATAAALVAAARDLFARRGYDGTSIRAITSAAGVNLGAVTYHFGTKRALYEEVLRTVVEPLRERIETAVSGGADTPLHRVALVVRCFFRHLRENPDMPQLMLQEMAAGKEPPPPVVRTLGPILRTLAGLVVEGQRSGQIREGDPALLALSCVAQPVHLTLAHRWARTLAGLDLGSADEHERVVGHAVGFAVRGLEAR